MTSLLGLPLREALDRLAQRGVAAQVVRASGPREDQNGTERVIRVSEDGRRLTVARFRDAVKDEEA